MKKIISLVFCCLFILQAQAVTVPNLYQASYPVASEQTNRAPLFEKGLAQVLVKVSGNSQLLTLPPFKQAVQHAGNYIDQYLYRKAPNPQKQLLLTMRFSSAAINQLLRSNSQAIWGSDRPLTLVWLVINHGDSTQLVSAEQVKQTLAKTLETLASDRGFPLEWPMMDLTDMQLVSASAVQQGNVLAVQNASQRYLPNAILMITVNAANPSEVTSQWTLLFQGGQQQWHASGNSVEAALQSGLNDVVDAIAANYAVKETKTDQQTVELQVSNITSAPNFARVERYLAGLTGVANVQLLSVREDQASFKLQLNGSLRALLSQIQLGRRLLPTSQYGDTNGQQVSLSYQYAES